MRKYINDRFPEFIHGADYNPEQWTEYSEIWDEDMRLMELANCNEMTIGIFSWAKLEPREGCYNFSFLDEIIEKVAENGGKIVLATPSGARPRWLAEKYPEVLRVNEKGAREHFKGRHNHCYTSPIYREKVGKINGLLSKRYGKNPAVIAWHISNEYCGECYCPLCKKAFIEYLKVNYHGDIKELNRAYWSDFWSHTYDNFEQIEPPMENTERDIHALNLDWHRFCSRQTADFMKQEIAAVSEFDKENPVTTNMIPWIYCLNYNEFADLVDVAAVDSYPSWHNGNNVRQAVEAAISYDYFRTMKNRSFMLMESAPGLVNWKDFNKLKRPGMDTLASLQAVAHGGDSVQYFQWRKSRGGVEKFHGAVVDHIGTENTRIFRAVQKTGEILKEIGEVAGTLVKSRVAIIFDWENWWALDNSQGFQRNKNYLPTCTDYYQIFWKRGISVDIISPQKDFDEYDLIVNPMQYMVSEKFSEKIEKYVKNGGYYYATYMLGMVNETDLCHLGGFPAGRLKKVFGIWNEEIDSLYPEDCGEIEMNGEKYSLRDYAELIHLRGATALAKYAKDFYAGMPAYTVNAYGKGKAYYQAFRDTGEFAEKAISDILSELKIESALPCLPIPGVTAHIRSDGKREYLFVENYNDYAVEKIELGGEWIDMLAQKTVNTIDLQAFSAAIFRR